MVVQPLYGSFYWKLHVCVKRWLALSSALSFCQNFCHFFLASCRKWRVLETFCWHSSISVAVYSNNLIWHKHLVFPFDVQRSRSKFLTLLSLHNKPEPRPSQKGWLGSGCYVAIFVICDFFVNFRGFGCFLAFQLGSYIEESFFRVSSFTKVWLYSHNYHDDSV